MRLPTKRLVVLLVMLSVLVPVSRVAAADAKTSGVTIAPAFQDITLLQNQAVSAQSFAVHNNDNVAETFSLAIVDMGALDDTGGVVFAGLSADYQQKYGLARWVKLERGTITVAAHGVQVVNFNIINDDSLPPGGHYGAIIVKRAASSKAASNQVRLSPQAATLLFVRKTNGEIYKLAADSKPPGTKFWGLPSKVTVNFHNKGNVHVVPRGVVRIKTAAGRVIAKGIINPESSLTLPEHTRSYVTNLLSSQKLVGPGHYRLEVSYRYDGIDTYTTYETSFYFVDLALIGLWLLIGSAVVAGTWYVSRRQNKALKRLFEHVHQKVIHSLRFGKD